MKYLAFLAAVLAVAPTALAVPKPAPAADANPYVGVSPYAPKSYAKKLEETIKYFKGEKDHVNAGRTRTVQKIPTFAWVSKSADVRGMLGSIARAVG
jgi:cellulose 1,4-beta-cellobiosidase